MRIRLFLAIVAAAIAAPLAGAGAAPQALGLVATNAPVPLNCFAGECSAQFSTFCLQQARDIPLPGTPYRAVGDGLSLVAVAADGKARRLPGAEHLSITSQRAYNAVKISMSRGALEALGAVRAAVEVGPKVSLVPVPVVGDPDPQSAQEIAAATGPLRDLGDSIVDNAGPEADAARLTSNLINDLPDRGRVGTDVGDRLWQQRLAQDAADPETVAHAAEAYGVCRQRVEAGYYFSLRRCLELKHDEQMMRLNRRFWQAIVGS
ncbi:MAG: hypothetical protein ACE5LF_02245 [Alphaproteobacteria bacterium]